MWLGLPQLVAHERPWWDKAGGTETWTYSDDSRDQLTGHGAVRPGSSSPSHPAGPSRPGTGRRG